MSLPLSEKWFDEVENRVWSPVVMAHGEGFGARPEEGDQVYRAFWEGNPKIAVLEHCLNSIRARL